MSFNGISRSVTYEVQPIISENCLLPQIIILSVMQAVNCLKSLDCITASKTPELLSKSPLELLCLVLIMHLLIRDYEIVKSLYLAMFLSATAFSCTLFYRRSPKPLETPEGNFPHLVLCFLDDQLYCYKALFT